MIAEVNPSPSSSDGDGRDHKGKFAPGNKIGRGNIAGARVAELRRLTLECATPKRHRRVVRKLYKLALEGDMDAIREWLNRTLGKSPQAASISDGDDDGGSYAAPTLTRDDLEALLAKRASVLVPSSPQV